MLSERRNFVLDTLEQEDVGLKVVLFPTPTDAHTK